MNVGERAIGRESMAPIPPSIQDPVKTSGAVHGGILLAALAAAYVIGVSTWPLYMLLPLLVYAGIVVAIAPLRRKAPRLRIGRLGGAPLACAVALGVMTLAALVGFHALAQPDVTDLAARLPTVTFGNAIVAAICFSVVNATLEELIFRGVLWESLAQEWNAPVALVTTAVVFGLGHIDGYPPGPVGAALAGLYGFALGLLRWWTGGLGLATACHVAADATIFWLLTRPL
jgi:membrane protease YdiL (CAAX protease family)